jgi:hypothetical protein
MSTSTLHHKLGEYQRTQRSESQNGSVKLKQKSPHFKRLIKRVLNLTDPSLLRHLLDDEVCLSTLTGRFCHVIIDDHDGFLVCHVVRTTRMDL